MEATHVTQDGMLVELTGVDNLGTAQVKTRTGRHLIVSADDLYPIASGEAEEVLEDLGLRTAQVGQEEDSLRVTLANWAQAQDNARAALAKGITDALNELEAREFVARANLYAAMAAAQSELAKFRP